MLTVVAIGLLPALEATRGDLHEPLKQGGTRVAGSGRSHRLRRLLVCSEVSLAFVLLIGAGLMTQAVLRLQRIEPGFTNQNILTARIHLPETRYPEPRQRQLFFDRLREDAGALPGVISAATVLERPLDNSETWDLPIAVEGQGWDELIKNPLTNFEAISPAYFRTLGIDLLSGRDFTEQDIESSPLVTIVSKSLADRFWPGQKPLGKRLRRVFADEMTPWMAVVGVVDDVHYRGWGKPTLDLYVPARQNPIAEYMSSQDLVLHTRVDPASLSRALRETVYAIDPNQPIASLVTLENLADTALATPRFTLLLMGVFGTLALCLAAVGIYGLLSYTVAQRSREICIRMALGARQEEILRMVIGHGLKLTATGLAVGFIAALFLTRFLVEVLHGVSSLDPLTFVFVPVFLGAIAVCASLVPALRATRADPIQMLHL
jgi:putative ABC transport system permease protein